MSNSFVRVSALAHTYIRYFRVIYARVTFLRITSELPIIENRRVAPEMVASLRNLDIQLPVSTSDERETMY